MESARVSMRTSQYVKSISKYDFSSLQFPVSLSSIGSFTSANNMSTNVYDVGDDKKVIYPLRVSSTQIDTIICNCSNLIVYSHGDLYNRDLHVYSTVAPLGILAD